MKRGMGVNRNFKLVYLVLLISGTLIISFSMNTSAGGIAVWPAKLTITISEDFPDEDITHKIMVENRNEDDVTVDATTDNPTSEVLKKGFVLIPDLAWITILPKTVTIPPGEARYFDIFIDIL